MRDRLILHGVFFVNRKRMMKKIFDFTVLDSRGHEHSLRQYEGKVLLIVNTASKCGFTPQFAGLEALHKKYAEHGLIVLGFPCGQFAGQELATTGEAESFCKLNYGVSFPIMSKIDVNGANEHEVFHWLKQRAGGWFGSRIKWNFTKFLIAKDGETVERFAPVTSPASMEKAIRKALGL